MLVPHRAFSYIGTTSLMSILHMLMNVDMKAEDEVLKSGSDEFPELVMLRG
jgi:hypothetical protein